MKYLITGYKGQLGYDIKRELLKRGVSEEDILAIDKEEMDKAINEALSDAEKEGIKGKDTTPYLLAKVKDLTKGESLESNIKLVYNNAKVGSLIANELCALRK